jgi:hypothetical protein
LRAREALPTNQALQPSMMSESLAIGQLVSSSTSCKLQIAPGAVLSATRYKKLPEGPRSWLGMRPTQCPSPFEAKTISVSPVEDASVGSIHSCARDA